MATQCLRRADGSVDYFVGWCWTPPSADAAKNNCAAARLTWPKGNGSVTPPVGRGMVSTGEIFLVRELFRIYGVEPGNVKRVTHGSQLYSSGRSLAGPEDF